MDVKNELNVKITTLAANLNQVLNEEIKNVSNTCVGWFKQLKEHIEKNSTSISKNQEVITGLQKESADQKKEIADLKKLVGELVVDAEYKTEHAFRLQLVAYNIPETEEKEDCFLVIRDFMHRKLNIDQPTVQRLSLRDVHRLGKKQPDRIRPMVFAFLEQPHRDFVLKQAKHLAGSDLGLQPHLSKRQLEVKKTLLAKRKTIKNHDRRILAFITYRAYRPILLVKVEGRLVQFSDDMRLQNLQHGDRRPENMD